jgi:hypothetical protein
VVYIMMTTPYMYLYMHATRPAYSCEYTSRMYKYQGI